MRFADQYALAFSLPQLQGNARFVGMGGAFGALGGNLSGLTTNPAGIGIYRRGDFVFTPTLAIGQTETQQVGGVNSPSRFNDRMGFNVMNFGLVNAWDISRSESANEWKMVQLGFGVNRKADFWNRSSFTNTVDWTVLDELTWEANIHEVLDLPSGTLRGAAHGAGLIFFNGNYNVFDGRPGFFNDLNFVLVDTIFPNSDTVTSIWLRTTDGLTQHQTSETRGGINEWFLTFGGNFGDMLYLGATIGMPVVNFHQTRTLREVDEVGMHPDFTSWRLRETLDISGTGVNLKLGAIIRPSDFMRIGVAFHTPTRFALRENLTIEATGIRTRTDRLDQFEYTLRTPMRLIGSLGFVIGRQAMIGIEYEHINFGNMRLTGDDPQFDLDNDFIRDNYRTGGVFRVGGEFRLDPVNIRLGYNLTMSPFEANSEAAQNFTGHTFTAGLGFVLGSTTIDIAYVNALRGIDMQAYSGMPWNRYSVSAQQFQVTFGWRFGN